MYVNHMLEWLIGHDNSVKYKANFYYGITVE